VWGGAGTSPLTTLPEEKPMPSGRIETLKYAGMTKEEKSKAYLKNCYEKHKEQRQAYGRKQSKLYREKNREVVLAKKKDQWLKLNFKRTPEWYEETLTSQDRQCALCSAEPGERRFQVDHDHNCCPIDKKSNRRTCGKCVRGLLCEGCNTELGSLERLLRDFPTIHQGNAEVYLRNNVILGSWTYRALRYLKHYSEESVKRYVATIPTLETHPAYTIVRYPPQGKTQENSE
jgi:hypothetical protein